ncbi:MAG: hypothetical protein KAT15_00825, partial [Bacteroidales bacterium]|nr:hypothetical protein [Bacteroidales bacterium]
MRKALFLQGRILLTLLLISANPPAALSQIRPNQQNQLVAPLPEALVSKDGIAIESPGQWENVRREEVLELFRSHVYGRVPDADLSISHQVKFMDMNALSGSAIVKEVEVKVGLAGEELDFTILVFLPENAPGPVPLFVGLNFYGNHTIHPYPGISITESWVQNNPDLGITENKATERSRGARAHRWPVELILSGGYGLATIYYGDLDPDFH